MTCYEMKTNFGIVEIENNSTIVNFKEKPKLNLWFNIGYFLFNSNEIRNLKNYKSFRDFITKSSKNKKFILHKHSGKHITINTISELEKARRDINIS